MQQIYGNAPPFVETEREVQEAIDIDYSVITDAWQGIHVSTRETKGFSGTAMSLRPLKDGKRSYRNHFYSCVSMDLPELTPIIETTENELKITERYELRTSDGTLHDPLEHVTKYTLRIINGRFVLLRDDALRQFELNNRLYDYGVLVKISDDHDSIDNLSNAPHPSIRDLYEDPGTEWNDPFVYGPNSRK